MSYEQKTGELYRRLFSDYSEELFEESVQLQVDRFKRWGLPIRDARCLDVGCGGGRTLVALLKLGAREVHGIDLDETLVALAKRRSGAYVVSGTALRLPYEANTFDLVVSSGVLHHTPSIKEGIREIRRVLKPGGTFYLMLYLYHPRWFGTKIMRWIANVVPFSLMQRLLSFVPANKRYNMMDNWYVKYMWVLKREEILSLLGDFYDVKEVDRDKPAHNIRLMMRKR